MIKKELTTALLLAAVVPMTTHATSEEVATGTIETNILFHHADQYQQVQQRNLMLSLYRQDISTGQHSLIGNVVLENPVALVGGYPVTVTPVLATDDTIERYQITISGLEQNTYSIGLSGKYHCDYLSPHIEIQDSSKQLTLSTSSANFTYGDLNGDNAVDSKDMNLLQADLLANTHSNDITGDGKVDISDVALLQMNLSATATAVILDTTMIQLYDLMDITQMESQWTEIAQVEGDIAQLFTLGNSQPVTLTPPENISQENPLIIPLLLEEPTQLAEIRLTSTTEEGGLDSGFVEVVYENSEGDEITQSIPFSNASSQSQSTLSAMARNSEDSEENVVIISLGERVVVKTITVTVEQVNGDSYAVLKEVNFVKDLVPEDPQASNGIVENIVATAGDQSVTLSWTLVPNISGYRIHYGTSRNNYSSTLNTTQLSTTITGLENFTTYYFALTSTHGDWTSGYSSQVSAQPLPSTVPAATTFLEAIPFDQGATLRWQSNSKASSYRIYAKKTGESSYNLVGSTSSTTFALGELENGEEYTLYVTGVNNVGEGTMSNRLTVIPEKQNTDGPTLPSEGRLANSIIESVVMQDPSNVKTELYPNGFDLSFITDDDYTTDWVANVWYQSSSFTFTFDDSYDMSYMVYVGKLEGDYRSSLSYATVNIWTDEDDLEGDPSVSYTDTSIRTTNLEGEELAIIDFPRSKVKKIMVMVAQWNGSPTNVSLSEIVFYEHNTIDDDIANLFANDTFTSLKNTITQEEIDTLQQRVDDLGDYIMNRDILHRELELAQNLLSKEDIYPLLLSNFVSIDNAQDDPSLCNISPLGILGYAGEQITIYAQIPEGETLEILPSQYYSEPLQHLGSGIVLESGRNILTVEQLTNISVTKGGPMYYRYTGDKGDEITLHIDRRYNSTGELDIVTMPVLSLYHFYDLTEAEVKENLEVYLEELSIFVEETTLLSLTTNPTNSTELSLRNVLLSLPATEVYDALQGYDTRAEQVEALYQNILAWEELLMVCNVAYGLDDWENPREARQNIRYMRMSDTAFMYAAGNHIGIQYSSVASLLKGQPTSITGENNGNSLFGWGIAHEIGHNLDRLGRPEITNNIYSLLAQTYDGNHSYGASRLEERYTDIYAKVTSGNQGIANNVFVQLGMYWQLQQAYCDQNPLEFYNLVNKTYKNGLHSSYSGDERFAVAVSHVVGYDLSSFFTAWGVVLSSDAVADMAQFPEETRQIQYFNDHSREYRLEDGTAVTGYISGSLNAQSSSDNLKEVDLTFYHSVNEDLVLGYEWYRNGVVVGFTTDASYTDNLGALNNTALEYSVKIVDKLGNYGNNTIKAQEFRVEYDNVVDSDLYTVQETQEGLLFTFTTATPLSGILLQGTLVGQDFTVEILAEDDSSIIAKTDTSYDQSKSLHYFNKPNVPSTDTRIAVYDCTQLLVTGITSPDEISFLSYIGDNVSFMAQPVGILGEEFDTGAGILPEGTVVVLGEYLGDPYFTEITLMGRFSHSHAVDGEEHFEERAFSGTTYLIAYETETVSTISDGLFLFVPDVQSEAELQGDTTCTYFSVFPSELKAVMERNSDTGNYQTSDTVWISVPTEDSMPLVYIN